MSILKSFENIGKNVISLFENEEYNERHFQELLLQTNKLIRKLVFKYNSKNSKYKSLMESENIKLNNDVYVSVIFTDGRGSVTYEFTNHQKKELVTIFTNGSEHNFLMEGIEVINKEQKQEIYQLFNLSKLLKELQDICHDKKIVNEIVKTEKPELTVNFTRNNNFFDIENKQFIENKINRVKKKFI